MKEQTIGDYYERKRQERHEAWVKWQAALDQYKANPTYENSREVSRLEEKMVDAGNTGD